MKANIKHSGHCSLKVPRHWIWKTMLASMVLFPATPARADGIPEPSLVLYGAVNNLATGGSRLTFGPISWAFQSTIGGPPIVVNGVLTNINDQFSYVLHIPCEADLPGFSVSTTSLRLASSPLTYRRGQVTIGGITASFVNPAQTNLVLARTDRGRIERIDLTVNDSLLNGLPESWQLQYFGFIGVDPNADPDGDGLANLQEYKAGTSPIDDQSRFAFIDVQPDPLGGLRIDWSSVQGKFYILQRSSQLLTGFANVASHITATAPQNSYHDPTATGTGPYFYRLRVEE